MDIKFSLGHIQLRAEAYVENTDDGIKIKLSLDSEDQESKEEEESL